MRRKVSRLHAAHIGIDRHCAVIETSSARRLVYDTKAGCVEPEHLSRGIFEKSFIEGWTEMQLGSIEARSDEKLIAAIMAGCDRCAEALYRRHHPRLFSAIRRISASHEDAEDACQIAWANAFKSLHRYRASAAFGTWLHRIGMNAALSAARLQRRRNDARHDPIILQRWSVGVDRETLIALERSLHRLPPRMRDVMILHDWLGYPHRQIASSVGIQESSSRSQLFEARIRMRRDLIAAGVSRQSPTNEAPRSRQTRRRASEGFAA